MPDRASVVHLLRKATFGPTAAEVDAAERIGLDATLTGLLNPPGADPGAAATPEPVFTGDPYASLPANATREDRQRAQQESRTQILALLGWWLACMASSAIDTTLDTRGWSLEPMPVRDGKSPDLGGAPVLVT